MRAMLMVLWVVSLTCGMVRAQSPKDPVAATVAQAKAVLDLSGETLVPAVDDNARSNVARQSFQAAGNAGDVARKIDAILQSRGLQQLEGATFTEAYSSASYQKSGFTFSLTVMPTGENEVVTVTMTNLGNVDFSKLPKPDGATEVYRFPAAAMYVCDLTVEEASRQMRGLLQQAGWQWFGDTTASFFMRQNGVRLQVMCSAAPAQQGKTAIQFSCEQLSSALPVVADLVRVGYSDETMNLDGDSKLPLAEFSAQYRKVLEGAGWQATMDNPIEIDFRQHLIFRNKAQEMAELTYATFEDLTRFELKYMTAGQVAAENAQMDELAGDARKKREAEQARMENPPEILIDKPATATVGDVSRQSLEFSVPSGKARTVVADWLESRRQAGWKVVSTIDTKEIGEFTLTQGEQTLSLSFVDPGFIPGEITIKTSKLFQLRVK